jgi:hypothetical protein
MAEVLSDNDQFEAKFLPQHGKFLDLRKLLASSILGLWAIT